MGPPLLHNLEFLENIYAELFNLVCYILQPLIFQLMNQERIGVSLFLFYLITLSVAERGARIA
jgi:hypothetical protein